MNIKLIVKVLLIVIGMVLVGFVTLYNNIDVKPKDENIKNHVENTSLSSINLHSGHSYTANDF